MKKLLFTIILLILAMFLGAVALAEEVILPDPEFYFNRGYEYTGTIEFEEYPLAEYKAYSALLQEAYGMEIVEEEVSELYEFVYLEAPGVENSRTLVGCFKNSKKGSCLRFDFGESIILSALDTYAPSNNSATGEIAWNDGLTVMSPEQYLGIKPCDQIYQQDNWYCYTYTNRGYKWYGHGTSNPVDWYKMKEYVDALVASGYYEILQYDMPYSDQEYWCLEYIGPGKVTKTFGVLRNTTQRAAIIVQSNLGDIGVYFSLDITAHDLDETQKRLGTDIFVKNNNDDPSILPTCDVCNGSGDCTYCRGRGTDGITGGDCAVCDHGKCYACKGKGHK